MLAGGGGVGGRPEGSERVRRGQGIGVRVIGRERGGGVVIRRRRKSSRVVGGQLGGVSTDEGRGEWCVWPAGWLAWSGSGRGVVDQTTKGGCVPRAHTAASAVERLHVSPCLLQPS